MLLQSVGVAGGVLVAGAPLCPAQLQLVGITNSFWAYSSDNSDQYALGFPNVDTSQWPTGRGLFGNDSAGNYPYPFIVEVPGAAQGVQSSYYRTTFHWSGAPAGVVLNLTNYVDDGVVIYLNNVEITRWNINAALGAPITHQTLAAAPNPGGEPVRVTHRIALDTLTNGYANPLVSGANVLAASVHQNSPASGDSVFGLAVGVAGDEFLCGVVSPASPVQTMQCQDVQFTLTIPSHCAQDPFIQWYHGAMPIVGSNGTTLTLRNVQPGVDDGVYFARLTGSLGAVDSSPGSLTVTPDTKGPRIMFGTLVAGTDTEWRLTFDQSVAPTGSANDPASYRIRNASGTQELWVIHAAVKSGGTEVLLVTADAREPGEVYVYETAQPIGDDCAGAETAPGMTGRFFAGGPILDYGDGWLWRYSDIGVNYGTSWRAPNFDDRTWKTGRQIFHRNRADPTETTVAGQDIHTFLELTNYTANPPTNLPTVYLRLKLNISIPIFDFGTTTLRAYPIFDDGFIFYLNGVEIHRANVSAAADEWGSYSGGGSINAGAPGLNSAFTIPPDVVRLGAENTIAVMLKQLDGTSSDLTFGLRILAEYTPPPPLVIVQPPVATVVSEGHRLGLQVSTSGGVGSPDYQWFHDGVPIPGATSSLYTKVADPSDEGDYHVEVTNLGDTARSEPVPVTVRPVAVPYGHEWRYSTNSQDATLPATPWYAPNFDDSAWASGPGPLGIENTAATLVRLPAPLATPLPAPGPAFLTAYFRTTIDVPPIPVGSTLVLTHLVDDGAIFYFDGVRQMNYNGPETNPTYSADPSPGTVPGDGDAAMVSVPLTVSPGLHTVAVEVHQNSGTSSDVVFGAEWRILKNVGVPTLSIERVSAEGVRLNWAPNPDYSLYQAATITGPFTAVGGNPQGLYLISNGTLGQSRFFQLRYNGR